MKIEFMKNGFQIDGNKFIAYQAIALINEIKIKDEYKGFYDVVLKKHTEEFAEKQEKCEKFAYEKPLKRREICVSFKLERLVEQCSLKFQMKETG